MGHILTKSMRTTSILLIASMASVSMADDEVGWPFVRGPKFDNHAADVGLADAWPELGPPVLWTRPLGTGYSSFTALNGRVFTQYQTLGGQFVVCLDANTGQTVWEHRYDWPYDPTGLYPGPRSTPTLANGRVYFSGTSGIVGCLTENDGRLVWSMNLTERFGVEPVEFGYSCSPVVVQGKVLLPAGTPGASMVALHAQTGATVWKSGNLPASHVPAFPIQFEGRSTLQAQCRVFINLIRCRDFAERTGARRGKTRVFRAEALSRREIMSHPRNSASPRDRHVHSAFLRRCHRRWAVSHLKPGKSS